MKKNTVYVLVYFENSWDSEKEYYNTKQIYTSCSILIEGILLIFVHYINVQFYRIFFACSNTQICAPISIQLAKMLTLQMVMGIDQRFSSF